MQLKELICARLWEYFDEKNGEEEDEEHEHEHQTDPTVAVGLRSASLVQLRLRLSKRIHLVVRLRIQCVEFLYTIKYC